MRFTQRESSERLSRPRRLRPRRWVLLAAITAALLAVSACSSSGGGAKGGAKVTSAKVTSLTVWVPAGTPASYTNQFTAWGALNNTKINIVQIPATYENNVLTKWATGQRPDVVSWSQPAAYQLNPTKTLIDLSGYAFMDKLINPGFELKQDGHVWGLTNNFPSVFGLAYNKKVLASAGVTPPTNFADLLSACKTLKAKGITPLFAAGGDQWPLQDYLAAFLADLTGDAKVMADLNANKLKWTDPRFEEAVQAIATLRDTGCFNGDAVTASDAKMNPAVLSGTSAMALEGNYQYFGVTAADYKKYDDAIGFTGFSMSGNTTGYTASGAYMFVKSSNPARNIAISSMINYWMGDGYGKWIAKNQFLPILKGYDPPTNLLGIVRSAYEAVIKNGAPAYLSAEQSDVDNTATTADMQALLNKQLSPADFLKQLQQRWETSGKRIGLPGF